MMFYHGSDKKRHKDQVRKVAFTLQFLGTGSISCMGLQYLVQLCALPNTRNSCKQNELSVLVRSLSKQKSTGSMLTLMELNKRISSQERVYRKRKLKSMVIFLIFLLSHCTVERSVW